MTRLAQAGLLTVVALGLALAATLVPGAPSNVTEATWSQVNTIVGVDLNTSGNTDSAVGTINVCRSVNVNDTFDIDLFVKDVTNINSFEGAFRWDGTKLQVTAISVASPGVAILARTPGSTVQNLSDPVLPNSTGSFLAGALDTAIPRKPETGSGVLARLTLKATAAGTSRASYTFVLLRDQNEAAIGDLNGNDYFDGLVFNAVIVVGSPCQADQDLDGFTNVEESVDGSELLNATSTPEMCDNTDNDKDGQTDEWYDRNPANGTPDCIDAASDTDSDLIYNPSDTDDDNDGYTDAREAYLGTDSLARCAQTLVYHSAWPLDVDNSRDITVTGDVFQYRGLLGATPGNPNFRKRLDLDGSGDISVTGDVFGFRGRLGETCTP